MKTTRKIIFCALLASLTCVATMLIKIPSPLNGYLNLGDAVVLLSGFLLPMPYAFSAAALGSGLADVFSGYAIYAPATFLIKGLMALLTRAIVLSFKKKGKRAGFLFGAVAAELVMVAGYLLFESILYGFIASLVNVIPNALQGVAGILVGFLLVKLFEKQKIAHYFE